jgi:hypothetical protein
MTGLVETTKAGEQSEGGSQDGEVNDITGPIPRVIPARRNTGLFAAIDGWRGIGWLACGVAGGLLIAWFIFLGPGETGSKADWFFGAVVFAVVLVAVWQTVTIGRQAAARTAEADERLHAAMAAAEERSARELALTRDLHKAELELHKAEMARQQESHHAEMEAQRELARRERGHLVNQLQRQAMIEVSRSVSAQTQLLATLWNRGAAILEIKDRAEREQAMLPIFEQIGNVVNDFSVELGNAHLLVEDDDLHQALNRVNDAVLMAIKVAQDVCDNVVEGVAPQPDSISSAQRTLHDRAAEARRLAWDLLRTGLADGAEESD